MPSKYGALETHLRSIPVNEVEVTLTFAEVETIIGTPLPASHLDHKAWWSNETENSRHVQALAWTKAIFMVDGFYPDKNNGWVRFVRTATKQRRGI